MISSMQSLLSVPPPGVLLQKIGSLKIKKAEGSAITFLEIIKYIIKNIITIFLIQFAS